MRRYQGGDPVEINGRNINRTGTATEKGEYLHDEDGDYFACMIAADIEVGTGDSGGAVLVRGQPAGVASRSFDGFLGFTPLAEGLVQLGLELCTTPDCDLVRPQESGRGAIAGFSAFWAVLRLDTNVSLIVAIGVAVVATLFFQIDPQVRWQLNRYYSSLFGTNVVAEVRPSGVTSCKAR